ncbi:prepilin peptidase [Heyndrickxia camelliae]|uniref:prepilin peptidase n=1 Tax=Heyndrickxia camelliae TaxID=1707093 RepID=UPI0018EED500|nr:A24 family peptidase [Heyndrickxia camelliae]
MNGIIITFLTVFGLILGSFFNVVGIRVPKKESIMFPGSHCPACKHRLKWFELIPIFSYLFLKGRCHSCGIRISFLYPFVEMVTSFLFLLSYFKFGLSVQLLFALLLVSLMVIIFVTDIVYMLIPDRILIIFSILFTILRILYPMQPWWNPYVGAIIAFLLLLIIAVISKGAMGGGDIKLFFVVGLALGVKGVFTTFILSTFLGAIFGIILMIIGFSKRKAIPFGPFIGVGAIISLLYSDSIISLYLNFFKIV